MVGKLSSPTLPAFRIVQLVTCPQVPRMVIRRHLFIFKRLDHTMGHLGSAKFVSHLPVRVQPFLDNRHVDSDKMATRVQVRPSAALSSLVKFRVGAHWLSIGTDRWLPSKPLGDRRICQHCHMQAVEDEQHLRLIACYTNTSGNSIFVWP